MFPVAVATAAGWLLLFFVLLALPPASQPSRDEDATLGTEPPAVVSLLAGRLRQDGLVVTLADLAARGWFQLSGVPGPAGPVGGGHRSGGATGRGPAAGEARRPVRSPVYILI